jgi:hypothetical protein
MRKARRLCPGALTWGNAPVISRSVVFHLRISTEQQSLPTTSDTVKLRLG